VLARGSAGLEREAPAGSLVDLVYENEEGRVSRRRVEIVRWSHARNGVTYLRAFCFLREEERTFRGDRIVEWRVIERDAPASPPQPMVFVTIDPPRAPTRSAGLTPPAAPVRRRGGGFLPLLGVALTALMVRGLCTKAEPSTSAYVPAPPLPPMVPAPRPAPRPAPKPAPPSDDILPDDRAPAFRAATGIACPELEAIYRGADRNGDDALGWGELTSFQSWLDRTYGYRSNMLALRPDQFLAQGGGDCEDWALFSCGLLRFWGWDPFVGSFSPSERAVGHAVCFVRVTERPSRFRAWSVDADGTLGGYSVETGRYGSPPEGTYVPVDYEKVGDLTNAVGDGWLLRAIWKPETIYGEVM
jgi:hypothetical protein